MLPFPKAPPFLGGETYEIFLFSCLCFNKGGEKGKSRILTDTPEKEEIKKAYLVRQARIKKSQNGKLTLSSQKRKKSDQKRCKPNTTKRSKTKSAIIYSSDETDTEMNLGSEEENTEIDYERSTKNST